jgi:hypothetical protein
MNRVFGLDPGIKDATVRRFHYHNHHQLRRYLAAFSNDYNSNDYNVGRRLKTLCGLTPCAFIVKCWTSALHIMSPRVGFFKTKDLTGFSV